MSLYLVEDHRDHLCSVSCGFGKNFPFLCVCKTR